MADAEKCMFCGIPIPEGRQICPACEKKYGVMPRRCGWGRRVRVQVNGHPVDPCVYEEIEKHENVTVTVLRCKNCGHVEIEWRNEDGFESET